MHYVTASQIRKLAPQILAHIHKELQHHSTVEVLLPTGAKLYGRRLGGRVRYHVSGYGSADAADVLDAMGCADPLARLRALGYTCTGWITSWRRLSLNELASMVDDLVRIPSTVDSWWNDRAVMVLTQLRAKRYPVGSAAYRRAYKLELRALDIALRAPYA